MGWGNNIKCHAIQTVHNASQWCYLIMLSVLVIDSYNTYGCIDMGGSKNNQKIL